MGISRAFRGFSIRGGNSYAGMYQKNICLKGLNIYYVSKKYLPILFSNLLYNMGDYFLDIQYMKTKRFWNREKIGEMVF